MVLQQLFCFQIPIVDAELRKAAGEEGTENEGGESSNNLHFSSLLTLSSLTSPLSIFPLSTFLIFLLLLYCSHPLLPLPFPLTSSSSPPSLSSSFLTLPSPSPSSPPPFAEEKRPSSAQLVTAHGTYATQSAFTATPLHKEEKM